MVPKVEALDGFCVGEQSFRKLVQLAYSYITHRRFSLRPSPFNSSPSGRLLGEAIKARWWEYGFEVFRVYLEQVAMVANSLTFFVQGEVQGYHSGLDQGLEIPNARRTGVFDLNVVKRLGGTPAPLFGRYPERLPMLGTVALIELYSQDQDFEVGYAAQIAL